VALVEPESGLLSLMLIYCLLNFSFIKTLSQETSLNVYILFVTLSSSNQFFRELQSNSDIEPHANNSELVIFYFRSIDVLLIF